MAVWNRFGAPLTGTVNATTYTSATPSATVNEIAGRVLITDAAGATTLKTPSNAELIAGFNGAVNQAMCTFSIIDTNGGGATLAGPALDAPTFVGTLTIGANASGLFQAIRSSTTAVTIYRIA